MEANKLQVKFFFDRVASKGIAAHGADDRPNTTASVRHAGVDFDAFVVVFHDWIRRDALSELMIDVADYSHVELGPGVVLVGHGSDYYIDNMDGLPGLLYSRKRAAPPPAERLKDAFRRAVHGARLLENEASLSPLKFRTNEVVLRIPDRVLFTNDQAGFDSVAAECKSFAEWLYAGSSVELKQLGTASDPLTVAIQAASAPELGALLERLGGPA